MSEMIYGIHAVQALLERAPERFQEVFILKGREDKRLLPLIHALESQGVVIQLANRQYLDEKSDGAVHQGIIARVKPGRQYQENDLPDLIASLDQPFGFHPWVRKIPWRGGHGNPLQYSCLENPMDRGNWWATVHRVIKSWT